MDLKNFLASKYSSDDFKKFLQERFYNFEILSTNHTDEDLSDSEKKHIQSYRYLGSVELDDSKEIGFFEFLSTAPNIENKRVGFNAILKKLADEYSLDGAIASFYHPDSNAWRLSFIGFEFDEGKAIVTNLKRYTYVLGDGIPIKTAYMQLKNLKYPTFEELKEIFSVERVTKEFYKGIEKLYFKLINNYLTYPVNDENTKKEFATRTIGRILFIKFLEKKTLIPSLVFEVKKNYYENVLEPLFFEQLSKPNDLRYELFKDKNIPFLNGGLFEAIKNIDFYEFDNELMCKKPLGIINQLKIEDEFFIKLYEHLNSFNFTIDENILDDSELSVDPEMLGRVFENFLAEINPETSKNARKATGSYYTPREIVSYMVKESLLEYLKEKTNIDEKKLKNTIFQDDKTNLEDYEKTELLTTLYNIKILDPACGSGAFPMGLLQEISRVLNIVDENGEIWFRLQDKDFQKQYEDKDKNYFRKLSIIQRSIYGVDIQPIAIEISKLRFFLSLIVDENVDDNKENRGIEPLPNLEFHFVCANTLLPMKKSQTIASYDYFAYEKKLKELKSKYFLSHGKEKENIKNEYLATQKKLFKEIEAINLGEALESSLINYNPFDPLSVADFFDMEFMFNIKNGFDIVIGNPPYIRIQSINNLLSEKYKKIYSSTTGKYDIYVIFVEKGLKLLKEGGILNFIMPHKWINSGFGKGLRKLSKKFLYKFVSFKDYQIFAASTYTSLIWFKKRKNNYLKYIELNKNLINFYALEKWLLDIKENDYTKINLDMLDENPWVFKDKTTYEILQKLRKLPFTIIDIFKGIYQGIVTGDNDVFYIYDAKIKGENVEGFSKAINDFVVLEKNIVKPILSGNDIKRYTMNFKNTYLIYPYYLNKEQKTILISENIFKEKYPLAYNYLLKLKDRLSNRGTKSMKYPNWYSLWNFRQIKNQNVIKIVTPDVCYGTSMNLDEKGMFFYNDTVYALIKKENSNLSYKFLMAVLNSNLCWFYLKNTGSVLRGGYFRFKTNYLKSFPFPQINIKKIQPFEILVDYIIWLKQNKDKSINEYVDNEFIAKEFERVIDAMVYELYFEEELHSEDLYFIKYANNDFEPIEKEMDDRIIAQIIHKAYQRLRDRDNEIRNNIKLLTVRLKDLILPIEKG